MVYFLLYWLCTGMCLDVIGTANGSDQWLLFELWVVDFWDIVVLPYAPERQKGEFHSCPVPGSGVG